MLRLMLTHHPEIMCAPEFEFLVDYPGYATAGTDTRQYREWLTTLRIFNAYSLEVAEDLDYIALCRSFFAQYASSEDKPIVGATVHKHFDRLRDLWPRPRYVHIVRDGRDVARSCVEMGWAGHVWRAVDIWLAAETLWERMRPTLDPDDFVEVRYEDLVLEPEATLDRICRFLGTTFHPAMFDYTKTTRYTRPSARFVSQWKTKLSPVEIGLVEVKAAKMLLERGYGLSDHARPAPTLSERTRLRLHDRARVFKFRSDRYGIPTVLGMKLARLLGVSWLETHLRHLIHRIDTEHLQ